MAECMTSIMTRPSSSGTTAAISWNLTFSPRLGSAGTSTRLVFPDGSSRGGRL